MTGYVSRLAYWLSAQPRTTAERDVEQALRARNPNETENALHRARVNEAREERERQEIYDRSVSERAARRAGVPDLTS